MKTLQPPVHSPPSRMHFRAWRVHTTPGKPLLCPRIMGPHHSKDDHAEKKQSVEMEPEEDRPADSTPEPKSSETPPQLLSFENVSPLMDGTEVSKLVLPASPQHSSSRGSSSPLTDAGTRINTPTRQSYRRTSTTNVRRSSAAYEHPSSHNRSPATTSQTSNGQSTPWSGAMGTATLTPTGMVIADLQAEIDRLKRALHAEKLHRQEVEKQDKLSQGTIHTLRTENTNLQQAKDTDANIINRRDRKIDELKQDLDAERKRRVEAERVAREALQSRDETVATSSHELSEMREKMQHATNYAEVLRQSREGQNRDFQQRVDTNRSELQQLRDNRDTQAQTIHRRDVLIEQYRQESETAKRANRSLKESFEAYKRTATEQITTMAENARQQEAKNRSSQEEAERVLGEARWLMNQMRVTQEREGRSSPQDRSVEPSKGSAVEDTSTGG